LATQRRSSEYLSSGGRLTAEQRTFLAELLERLEGTRGRAALRRIDKELIRQQVNGLIEEVGLKKVAAVAEVMRFTRGFPPDRLRRPAGVQKVEVARARGRSPRARNRNLGSRTSASCPSGPIRPTQCYFLRYEPGMPCARCRNAQHKRKIRP
jgi:hypothetical protein